MSNIHYQAVLPEGWPRPRGYSHAVTARGGTHIRIAGQVGCLPEDMAVDAAADFATQWARALANVVTLLRSAGAAPEHLVTLRVYLTDMDDFRTNGAAIGAAWGETLGRHFPAMTLVQVAGFLDQHAKVEIEGEALLP